MKTRALDVLAGCRCQPLMGHGFVGENDGRPQCVLSWNRNWNERDVIVIVTFEAI